MKALVLCGDVGGRMQPLRKDKFTLGFLGKPLLQHVVDGLREAGIDDVVFVANGRNRELVSEASLQCNGVACHVVSQDSRDGLAGAVEAAAEYLCGPVLIVSSNDVVEQSAYNAVVSTAADTDLDGAMLACRVSEHFPGGYLLTDSRLRISRIVEKPECGNEPSDLVNVVVHFHRDGRKLLGAIRSAVAVSDDRYERALTELVGAGNRVRAVPYTGFWGPLKRPWDLFPIMEHFLSQMRSGIATSALVAPSAVIEGDVLLADSVRVLEHAVIRGPAYVGCGSVVGNNTLIRGGVHIGARCVVGFSTELKHSYIGDDCSFHSNYIGDSIIDDGCSFGSGSVTANLRFDERIVRAMIDGSRDDTGLTRLGVIMGRCCQTGINASLLPGVMVGPEAIVGPHVCLTHDLGPGMRARLTANYEAVVRCQAFDRRDRSSLFKELRKI